MVVDNEFTADSRVLNESRALAGCGHKVRVLCFSFGSRPMHENLQGIEVYRIHISRKIKNILFAFTGICPLYHYFWYRHIVRFAIKFNFHAIHAHDLYMARSAGNAARKLGIPMVLDLHENYPEAIMNYRWATTFPGNLIARPRKWKKLEWQYLNQATAIITLSESFAADLRKKYPALGSRNFHVYPNVPDVDEMLGYSIENADLPGDGRFFLFYFGIISRRRGIYTCLEALRIMIRDHRNITLVLAGPVEKHEKRDFLRAFDSDDIKDNLVYIPWIDIKLLPSYLERVHVCLSPILKNDQHESGVANKVFQYMLFEKPVVVSDCTPQSAIINEGRCGLIFECSNPVRLAEKIMELYTNGAMRKEMGQRGKKLVLAKYNLRNYGEKLCNLYSDLST
jgi:glycosyltransferase involved in cell wall biosynthesis